MQRSYIYGLATNWPEFCVSTIADGDWTLTLPISIAPAKKVINLKSTFYAWNSNRPSFDRIFEDFYIEYTDTATRFTPEAFTLRLIHHPATHKPYYMIDVGYWTFVYYRELPPSPTDYWTPSP